MKRKNNKHTKFKLLKYLPIILSCVLFLPANYSGKNLHTRNGLPSSNSQLEQKSITTVPTKLKVEDAVIHDLNDNGVPNPYKVTGWTVVIVLLILILSTILISLILGYLYSSSIVKQGLVLFLYQDTAKLSFLLIFSISFAIVTCYLNGNGITIHPAHSKVLSYFCFSLTLHLLLAANALCFLNFYSMKEMVIDPYLQWVEDEQAAMKKLRVTSIVLVTSVTSLAFATGGYPKMYFNMIGNNAPITELPIGTFALTILLGLLVVTCMCFSVAAKCYQRANIFHGAAHIPNELTYFPLVLIWFIAFIIISGIFLNLLSHGKIWEMLLMMQIVYGVASPALIISTSFPLRTYVKSIFQDATSSAMDIFRQFCTRRQRQIHPIE